MASNRQLTHNDQSDVILKIGEILYLNEEMADFHFIFEISKGEYERVPAHKLLLVTASDVFRTMFNETWDEKDEVEIVDASFDEFIEFLQFFYLHKVNVSIENIPKVMYLGDKYNITKCLNVCEKFIINILKDDNIIWAYELAIVYNQAKLRKYCETHIGINTKAILTSKSFLECDSKALGHILKLDLFSCPENEVFEACMNWVNSTAKVDQLTREVVQAQLGDLFYEIRIKSMTPQEFATLVPTYGYLFSNDEYGDILQAIALQEFQPNIFNKNLRTPFEHVHCDKKAFIDCDRKFTEGFSYLPFYIKSIETTRFSTNTSLLLKGFQCCDVYEYRNMEYHCSFDLPTEITIVQVPDSSHSGVEIVLHNGKYTLRNSYMHVTLPKPLLIKSGITYDIRMKQSPSETDCTGRVLKSNVQIEPNIIVQFHKDSTVADDKVTHGMITSLEFYRIHN